MSTIVDNANLARAGVTARDAIDTIYAQHRELRRILALALDIAQRAEGGSPPARRSLRLVLESVGASLERHLASEESILLPILEDDLPVGPQRAAAVRIEHHRQREEIDRLVRVATRGGAGSDRLIANLRTLVHDFLIDMKDEERELLRPDVLRDDHVIVDQCCG